MNDIEKGAYEARVTEVIETFEYAKKIALRALEKRAVRSMSFTVDFDMDCVPTVSHSITELYI